jgi:uncharacterized protein YdeI (YjbR/CyaY-like superfamily)
MEITKTFYAKDRERWRTWLEKNHNKATEIWLVFYKKHTKRPSVPYVEAVEEALCFGWIDGISKRVDEEKYAQRFSPRKKNSPWSDLNRQRAKKMIDQGRMTDAGLQQYKLGADGPKNWRDKLAGKFEIPGDLKKAIAANEKAQQYFQKLPEGYKKLCIGYVICAKRPETREKRIRELVELTAKNKRLGMK